MPEEKPKRELDDVEQNKGIAAIGYIWILCFIPLLLKRDSKFAQFHGKQGLVLFVVEVVAGIVMIIPVIGWFVGWIVGIITIILSVMGILQALQGNQKELPIIGQYAKKFNI